MRDKKKRLYLVLFTLILVILLSSFVLSQSTGFTDTSALKYTGVEGNIRTVYQDGISPNADIGLQLCDISGHKYIGGFYAIKVLSEWKYVLVTYKSSTESLSRTSNIDGSCRSTSGATLTISPSELTTPDPDVKKAAHPGYLWIGSDDDSANPGTISDFEWSGSNAELDGDYDSVSPVFDQNTRLVTLGEFNAEWQGEGYSVSRGMGDSTHGLSSDRPAVIGLCSNSQGSVCSAGDVYNDDEFPLYFSTGLSANDVNDQNTYTRYIVVNGISDPFCIGSNLQVGTVNVGPDPVYYNQTLSINITLSHQSYTDTKGGNVDVTSPFLVRVRVVNSSHTLMDTYVNHSTGVTAGSTSVPIGEVTWNAIAHSGDYYVYVDVDTDDTIEECVESDNSDTSTEFELKPITLPQVYIDGYRSTEFPYANVPYSVRMSLQNSDTDVLRNATVNIIERNGLNVMAPMQIYNRSIDNSGGTVQSGIVSLNKITFLTDYDGQATFTFVPTYNNLYDSQYSYLDVDSYVGNYDLYFYGVQADGETFKFVQDGGLYSNFSFTIGDTDYSGPFSQKSLYNSGLSSQVFDFIYTTYTNFVDTVTG